MNRLDVELVERKMAPTRTKAQDLIKSNLVKVDGCISSKASLMVSNDNIIEIMENDKLKYVSRGGLKLDKALNTFNIDVSFKRVLDIGSSTGGFTDCVLKHNAASVIAIDVGTNIMHESLRKDKRITLLEQTNFKTLDSKYFKDIDMIVCDVSFISLKPILKKIYDEKIKIEGVFLIKPQFECGKDIAFKYKGIINNKSIHIDIINDLVKYFNSLDFYIKGITISPIKGGDGNTEYLVYLSNMIEKNIKFNVDTLVNTSSTS